MYIKLNTIFVGAKPDSPAKCALRILLDHVVIGALPETPVLFDYQYINQDMQYMG